LVPRPAAAGRRLDRPRGGPRCRACGAALRPPPPAARRPPGPARPGAALRARRRRATGGAVQPRRREQRRRILRRPARDLGVERLHALQAGGQRVPLHLGNLMVQRDWGFAPNYVDAMIAILRQTEVRRVPDEARYCRDYVVGTGRLHHVWELADRAFALAGFE